MPGLAEKVRLVKSVITKNRPLYVQFAVSKNCDLKCRMCHVVESRKHERELSLDEIKRLAETLASLDIGVLVLTGGEPLLRKDLPQIIEAFISRGINVRLQTNATLATDRRVEALVAAGLKEVTISLDTLDAAKQDDINNSEGSWMRIIRGISVFSRHLPLKGNISGINIVVSRLNLKEIPALIRFTTAIGFYASLIPVHVSDAGSRGSAQHEGRKKDDFIVRADSPDFAFSSDDFPSLDSTYAEVLRMKKNGFLVYNSKRFLRESPDFLKYKRIHWKCDSPALYFSISPEGRFLPCVDIKTDKSMLSPDFAALYRSKVFRREIREIVERCPGCMYACWPEITYLCRDPFVFTERLIEGIKINSFKRKAMSQEEILRTAEEMRIGQP